MDKEHERCIEYFSLQQSDPGHSWRHKSLFEPRKNTILQAHYMNLILSDIHYHQGNKGQPKDPLSMCVQNSLYL